MTMKDVLRSISAELEWLRVTAGELEAFICEAAQKHSGDDRRLQQLDLMLQHLVALRDFVSALSEVQEGSNTLDEALALVPLEQMRARLSGKASEYDNAEPEFFR